MNEATLLNPSIELQGDALAIPPHLSSPPFTMQVKNQVRLLPPSTVWYIHDRLPTLTSFPIAGLDIAHYSYLSLHIYTAPINLMLVTSLARPSLFGPAIWAMNAFPAGTRVYYWTPTGETVYGTVQNSGFLEDGTQILTIVEDSGRISTLPAVGIYRVL